MSIPELSVVLPGYNEREGLREAVETYLHELSSDRVDGFELVIVDDGSTDGTGALADELAASEPRIRVLHHERNLGQVAGIMDGFRASRGRIVTHNAIDLPFHPRDSIAMVQSCRQYADVVVVERKDRSSYTLTRKILSWVNVFLLRLLFQSAFRDHNFVQFFRREALMSLPVRSTGVNTVTPELIFRAQAQGFRVVRQEAEYHERRTGRSSIEIFKVMHALRETFRLWLIFREERQNADLNRGNVRSCPPS
jgi:glycosyltransferase involved in cell wall biosynthesis